MHRFHRALRAAALGFALPLLAAQAALANEIPPAPVASASFDAGSLHVDRYGNGARALILIPGLGSGPWSWYGTIARFAPQYTVYVLTLPGFDGRPATSKTPLFDTFASDFWAFLEQQHVDRPVIVGHSLGGTLGLLLAQQHPERLAGVIAVDGLPVFPMLAQASVAQRDAMAAQSAAKFASLDPATELAYETNFMATIGTRDPQLVAPAAKLEARSDPKAVAAWLAEDLRADLRPAMNRAGVPILEIAPYDPAGGSPFTQEQTVAFYRSLLAGAPNATVVALAPARHFAMLDQPDAFYAQVTQFLAALP